MTFGGQVPRHGRTHDAKSEKSDFHLSQVILLMPKPWAKTVTSCCSFATSGSSLVAG